jgi:hypothetical protein
MRPCKLEGWNEESCKELENLKNKANLLNLNSQYDCNNNRITYHVIKLYNIKGDPYFILQKRTYKKRQCDSKKCVYNNDTINEIKKKKATGMSLYQISKDMNISMYYVNKILRTSI